MENNELSLEEAQQAWDEEATKLDAGDDSPAFENSADVPEDPPHLSSFEDDANNQPEQPEDPLAGLPQVVRDKIAKIDLLEQSNAQLLHHVRSAEGRVAAMQRELQQARVAQQTVAPQDAPSQGQISKAAKNPEKWEQLKQDFPEWADAMEEYVAAKVGNAPQQQGLDPRVVAAFVHDQVQQTKAEMARTLEETRIEGKYENWREVVNSPDFVQWFSTQPPEVQTLANSPAARDAIRMLDMFHTTKTRTASGIRQERGARLAAAATARPGQTPPPRGMDDLTFEEQWNLEAKRREKEKASRGY